jgi:D-alanyl-D-alanine carboxypeptidase/D-alanyl-D-alanine-endopeptidase (penicillin-binding protein 4)
LPGKPISLADKKACKAPKLLLWRRRRPAAAVAAALCALAACAATGPATAAAQGDLGALQADLSGQLALAGSASTAYVYDITAGQPLFSVRGDAMRAPASVQKLYTAATALERLGPDAHLTTALLGTGRLAAGGVWEGSLYLRGGGDPTFGSSAFIRGHYGGAGASVSALATQLARRAGIREVTGSIAGDESYFNALRGEPSSAYAPDPFLEGTLSGLAFNRGESGRQRGAHAPAVYAARQLWAALKGAGVKLDGSFRAAPTPPTATLLAQVPSPALARLLALTLPLSDNFFAETLLKDLGASFAGAGSTAAGAAVVRATIGALFGLHPRVVDGSGLSPADQTSTHQVATLLAALAPTPIGAVLRGALAVAGRSGTLRHRMRATVAAGRCQAKTGTLEGVSNLAGYCQSTGGDLLAFAIFTGGIAIEAAHRLQDHIVITLAGY